MNDTYAVEICPGDALAEGGRGVRFEVTIDGRAMPAFVVRYGGAVFGYLNQCAHVPMELDWQEGQFFEGSGLYLMCATHGAMYEPDTGHCVGGPCRGAWLCKLDVEERGEGAGAVVVWLPDERIRPPANPGAA
ncbi:Rieske (2Fe-2S) protein [Pandoraea terrae]|uniref:Rieske (2Fe-2S) protein n=1 Tax=Pandoraea terrae TaxID=1537710 RepID=A0A5E4TW44_9BURK|nr:Rieske 2Fe-2S domain-containing protein [Pandoraea terrae]VVD91751.1 Rieske (2Fe-2S) protein [Pandoraea terrae]